MSDEEMKAQQKLESENAVLKEALRKLTLEPDPIHVKVGNESVFENPADIASGKIVLDFPEPEEKPTLKDNQVSRTDRKAIGRNIQKIASGEIEVV